MKRRRKKIREPLFVVEARHADGTLNLRGEQPPDEWIHGVTQWAMGQWYYRLHPGSHLVDMATIYAYMQTRGWYVRPKT